MDKRIVDEIINKMGTTLWEDCESIEVDGIKYDFAEEEMLTTEDEGKYQYGGTVFGVGLLNEEKGYGIVGEPLFYLRQNFTQTGSYYSYQERMYEEPYEVEKREVVTYYWFKKER